MMVNPCNKMQAILIGKIAPNITYPDVAKTCIKGKMLVKHGIIIML